MNRILTKPCYLRLFILSVLLVWTFMFNTQQVKACDSSHTTDQPVTNASILATSSIENEELTIKQVVQHFSEDASTSAVIITLQQAATHQNRPSFAFPSDEAVPPYAARAPGISYLNKFFPTSIQPHAP